MRILSRPAYAFLSSLVLIMQTAVLPAHAQSAPPSSAAGGTDVVKLLDGSVYRGTIVELVPRDHVTLRVDTGEIRRFRMTDVYYQGDLANQPGPAVGTQPAQTLAPARKERVESDNGVPVRVVANDPDVELLVETSQAPAGYATAKGYRDVCFAPCRTSLPVGTYRMALSSHENRPVPAVEPVQISGPSTLQASYESRHGTRAAGIAITAVGGAAGLVIVIAGELRMKSSNDCFFDSTCMVYSPDTGLILAGAATLVVSTLIGVALIVQHDQATIQVVPFQEGLAAPLTVNRKEAQAPRDTQGLALRVAF